MPGMRCLGLVILMCCWATLGFAAIENPAEQHWSLAEIGRMESAENWTGPWPVTDITTSDQAHEGQHCLQVALEVLPGHRLRIEKPFVADCHDGFQNMLGMGMVDEDFAPYRTVSFYFRTDIANLDQLVFRLWDRQGGWLEWTIPQPASAQEWRQVILSLPPRTAPAVNIHRMGGMVWEIAAGQNAIRGKFWLDDMQFITDSREGLPATVHGVPDVDDKIALSPPPVKNKLAAPPFHILMNMSGEIGISLFECKVEETIKRLNEALAVFNRIEGLEVMLGHETPGPIKRNDPKYAEWFVRSKEAHVAVSKYCEDHQVPFYVQLGIGGQGPITVPADTVRAILTAAPQYCLGVVMGEFSIEFNDGIDETAEILAILKPLGKKCLYFQHSNYWLGVMMPTADRMMKLVLSPEYKDVFVPMWENLLPSAPGICLAGIQGLWRTGRVGQWGVSAQSWGYTNLNWGGTNDQPGNLWLRMFLSVASFGGTYIEIEPKWSFDGENVPGQVEHFKQWSHNLRWVGQRRSQVDIDLKPGNPLKALRLFDRMIKAGVVLPAAGPEALMSQPPVAFQVKPSEQWETWGLFRRTIDQKFLDGCCPNSYEMAVQVPSEEAFSYLFLSNHFYDQTLPEMPYGMVSILPGQATVPADLKVIPTDNSRIFRNQRWIPADQARTIVQGEFQQAAESLLFQAQNCTWSALKVGSGDYLITVMDPEEHFPVGVNTRLMVRLAKPWKACNAITGQELPALPDGLDLAIEPSGYRLIRIIEK